ncbi:hypothetical protein HP397_06530 [Streptobacillus felis]|uniref:Uncharacterized protein n=1 Tax=Streptobacillus felis TaxID=1384509 RepID=A0A7Z0PFR6_9FUSO|nr:hypothetical protein [Streptobacillus felis]NYV28453.1 hypothetical protein [Streptobacillus felis]
MLENSKSDEERISIIKSYYRDIGKVGGKEFKDVVFLDNITNDKGVITKAGTTKDNTLYININNVDVLDLESMKKLVTYETNRWKYENEEIDDNTLHYKQEEINGGKTSIEVETKTLTMEEMSELRNYTYVPRFSEKEIQKQILEIEKSLDEKNKKKFNKLNDLEKRNVANNILLKEKIEGTIDKKVDTIFYVDNPNNVYTGIDTKRFTVDELNKIAQNAYKDYSVEKIFIKI